MSKKRFLVALIVGIVLTFVATPAFAKDVNLGNGLTASSSARTWGETTYKNASTGKSYTSAASKTLATPSSVVALSTGKGGYVATSGYRYIETTITYKFLGDKLFSSRYKSFFRFKGGKVYDGQHVVHTYWIRNGAFYRLNRWWVDPIVRLPWNGHTLGQVRMSGKGIVRLYIPFVGEVWEMRPAHYHTGYYNGTFRWRTEAY